MTVLGRRLVVGGVSVDEARFIALLRRKDREATRRLVKQLKEDSAAGGSLGLTLLAKAYGGPVVGFVARFFGGDLERAQEIFSETLERVYTRIGSFDPSRSAFRTWVFEQARYAALDSLRRSHRDHGRDLKGLGELFVAPGIDDTGHLTRRQQAALRAAFRELKPTQRNLLWLRHVEGWTSAEIGRHGLAGKVPEAHVRIYVNRAATRLLSLYLQKLEDGE